MKYALLNSEFVHWKGPRPSECKRGTVIQIEKECMSCPWAPGVEKIIPAGTYKVIDRKHFKGGYQIVEKL